MPKESKSNDLSRRERMVMDIVYRLGSVSVAQVQQALSDEPTYSATRMLLQRLHKKNLLQHEHAGAKYLYSPITTPRNAGKAAWKRLVSTFFGGSTASAFSALLGASAESLTDAQLDELEAAIAAAKAKRK